MDTERITDMTRQELNQIIDLAVIRRLSQLAKPKDLRSTTELLALIEIHRITPIRSAQSALEMLREDRDA